MAYYPPPAPPPRRTNVAVWIVGILLAICIVPVVCFVLAGLLGIGQYKLNH